MEDVDTLAPFALRLSRTVWTDLTATAERLAAETLAAESELLGRPELHRRLGLPRWMRRALTGTPRRPCAPRVMRFDFHWATPGRWQISEVNADVPGGFSESSALPAMVAEALADGSHPAGDPLAAWADAIAGAAAGLCVAVCSAPGFLEDHQVAHAIADALRRRHPQLAVHTIGPRQITWLGDRAMVEGTAIDTIVRFCQAEWLRGLDRRNAGRFFRTPVLVCNRAASALVESKRFPLVWYALMTPMPIWRTMLPETRDPRDAPWRTDAAWLLKSAFCNTGDAVAIRGVTPETAWRRAARSARWSPRGWIAQRRFETVAIETPIGVMFPCVGVYVIDGCAAGAYGRLSRGPVVDHRAVDVAILLGDD